MHMCTYIHMCIYAYFVSHLPHQNNGYTYYLLHNCVGKIKCDNAKKVLRAPSNSR